jgi:hypothetical protein
LTKTPSTCWRNDRLFNKENYISTYRRQKLDPYLLPCSKINSKWTKSLNIRLKALKLPEENMRKIFEDTNKSNNFLHNFQEQELTELHEIKMLWTSKEIITKMKRQPTE